MVSISRFIVRVYDSKAGTLEEAEEIFNKLAKICEKYQMGVFIERVEEPSMIVYRTRSDCLPCPV